MYGAGLSPSAKHTIGHRAKSCPCHSTIGTRLTLELRLAKESEGRPRSSHGESATTLGFAVAEIHPALELDRRIRSVVVAALLETETTD